MVVVAGVDGCRAGWVCVVKDLIARRVEAHILPTIDVMFQLKQKPELVLVDIPIGLPDRGSRSCDLDARRHLKPPRSSSVFPAPVRPMLAAETYIEACEIGVHADGRKLSRQAWNILPKIREVDKFLRNSPQSMLREVHPEVSFWAWNAGHAMQHAKKTAAGKREREALVTSKFGDAYRAAQSSLPRGQYANDDLLDAFAALWSAERLAAGVALILPPNPPTDSSGLRMEIVV
jgi:predicted RNase H-like nuclease